MPKSKQPERLSRMRLTRIVKAFAGRRLGVLGDWMIDRYVWGKASRLSPEAAVPVVDFEKEELVLGGAGNVAANLVAFGARVVPFGAAGKDVAANSLRSLIRQQKLPEKGIIEDSARRTTIKTRIIAQNQMVVRADRELRTPVNGETETRIIGAVRSALDTAQALIVSDYDKGVVTPRILSEVLPVAYGRMPVLIDPKIRNFDAYRPATLVTPNHHEALRLAGLEEDSDETLRRAAQMIHTRLGCDAVLITRGDRGMMLVEGDGDPVNVETAAREVFDVTGAGDTVIAALGAALAAGASMTEAAVLANHAAGIVVGKLGTATASAAEVLDSIQ